MLHKCNDIQTIRDKLIRDIDRLGETDEDLKAISNDLFSVGLTTYSKNYNLASLLYNSLAESHIDKDISLHPEQIKVLDLIEKESSVIFSAPTSFGKTFIVFEYMARFRPNNIVLIAPTLALVGEYRKKIINKYKKTFEDYNIHTSISEENEYNFDEKNIFILTHDRIVDKASYSLIEKIDFLVIDEVYKLEKDQKDDRILILNLAYYFLSNLAKKYVLLAPFIDGIEKMEELSKKPKFYKTNYSPVVNEIITYGIPDKNKDLRYSKTLEILNKISRDEKVLIYFPTVTSMEKFTDESLNCENIAIEDQYLKGFIRWMESEIHEDWYLIKAMKKGFLAHNGQLPLGIRMYQMDLYESGKFNNMMCTSTLLEGVNTSAKHIIITEASPYGRNSKFSAFDFFNLVGRSGRLSQYNIGIAHYIKSPSDLEYSKDDAIKRIEFEITNNEEDIGVYKDEISEHEEHSSFLKELGISNEEYKEKIAGRLRASTVRDMYKRYREYEKELFEELENCRTNETRGRYHLIYILHKIFEEKANKFTCSIVNKLIHLGRPTVKEIVNELMPYFGTMGLNLVISSVMRCKNGYIEHGFYSKLLVTLYFMELDEAANEYMEIIEKKIKNNIVQIYFKESAHKRMLLDIGIYDRDIEEIIKIIGDKFKDIPEMIKLLKQNKNKLKNISVISRFIINRSI